MLSRSFSCTVALSPAECEDRIRSLLGYPPASVADVVCREAELASWSVGSGVPPVRFEGAVSAVGFSLTPLPNRQLFHSIHGSFIAEGGHTTVRVHVSALPRQVGVLTFLASVLAVGFTVLAACSPSALLFAGVLGAFLLLGLALAALEVHSQFVEVRALLPEILNAPYRTPEA